MVFRSFYLNSDRKMKWFNFFGIRFLIKPDISRENTVGKGKKLDWKGAAISLFFGLTIGFGTGFVGTGGGMMMLVVFTAFLGMELKTAVGASRAASAPAWPVIPVFSFSFFRFIIFRFRGNIGHHGRRDWMGKKS